MPLVPIVSSSDGPRVTVNDLVKSPTVVPKRILALAANQFIVDSVLRKAGSNFGAVVFSESTPLFADAGSSIRAEYAEYSLVTTSDGSPSVAVSIDRGFGILVSDEMRRRNKIDQVNKQMIQVKNTLVRDWESAFFTALLDNPSVQTFAAATAWTTSATIRKDLLTAQKNVSQATSGLQANNFLNFNPDTLIITETTKFNIMANDNFNASTFYQGNIADENLLYTGKMPNKLVNLDVLVVKSGGTLPDNKAIVLERGTVGFISDEEALQATALYREQRNRTWRSDVNRASAIGIDQPKAALIITAV